MGGPLKNGVVAHLLDVMDAHIFDVMAAHILDVMTAHIFNVMVAYFWMLWLLIIGCDGCSYWK